MNKNNNIRYAFHVLEIQISLLLVNLTHILTCHCKSFYNLRGVNKAVISLPMWSIGLKFGDLTG